MIIVHFCPNDGGPMYEWHWAHYLDELESAGVRIVDCNPNRILKKAGSPGENAEVLKDLVISLKKKLRGNDSVLFFGAQARDDNLDPSVIELMKGMGIACANICVDGFFEHIHIKEIGKYFDLNWVTHYNALTISKYGCRVLYMPMAANPKFFSPRSNHKEKAIAFVGSNYGVRSWYLSALEEAGLKIKVRGKGWVKKAGDNENIIKNKNSVNERAKLFLKLFSFYWGRKIVLSGIKKRILNNRYRSKYLSNADVGKELSLSEMVDFYSSCIMSLGIAESHNTFVLKRPLYQYKLRDFECPMIGCAHLVRRCKELEESFEDGKEILFYDSMEECIDKAKFYLNDNREAELLKIGSHARARSEEEHSWSKRFEKLCKAIGIKWK